MEKMENITIIKKELNLLQLRNKHKEMTEEHFINAVGKVAKVIAGNIDYLSRVYIAGLGWIYSYNFDTRVGKSVELVIEDETAGYLDVVVTDGVMFGDVFYNYNDWNIHVAKRDTYLKFTEKLPEIIKAFAHAEEQIIRELQEGFENLRKPLKEDETNDNRTSE